MQLLVDMGNSRVKWAEQRGELLENPKDIDDIGQLATAWHGLQSPKEIRIASVVSGARNKVVEALCQKLWRLSPRFARTQQNTHGVKIAYADPNRLGVDRWLAMIAARQTTVKPSLVVDCGTAVTLDALDAQGRHQGGLIAPGLHMMWNTLFAQTHIPAEQRISFIGDLGKDTPECAAAGILRAICGLIERTYDQLACEWGQAPMLILTGGDARVLSQELSCPLKLRPFLVLEGLAAL